jgi:hypothetical protein
LKEFWLDVGKLLAFRSQRKTSVEEKEHLSCEDRIDAVCTSE